jgi:hypothetical protein
MKAMQSCDYIKSLGAIRDEVNKPLEEWIARLDPSSLSDEKAAFDRFSFTQNLKALKRQADIDMDNKRFWAEEFRRSKVGGDAVRTFEALAAYSDTQYQLRQKTIRLAEAALRKLGP